MSDRIQGFTVTLDGDYRVEDAALIINAIRQIRGVASVDSHVTRMEDHLARMRVRSDLAAAFAELHDKIMRTS